MAKGIYFGVNNKARKVKGMYFGVNNKARKVTKGYVGVGGKARLFWETVISMPLSELPERAIVNVNENGTKTPFYLAKHDYESGLNGAGRDLYVRKDCYDARAWSTGNNAYANSSLDTWFNGDYKALFDEKIQEAMGTTTFYYTPGGNGASMTVSTLARSVFALSTAELALSNTYLNAEGSALPIASTSQIAYLDGSAYSQWTRSPKIDEYTRAGCVNNYGRSNYDYVYNAVGARPCFTLPSTMLVGATPNADGSYNLLI